MTVAFKQQKQEGLLLTAWRILRKVAGANTLLPDVVDAWYGKVVADHGDLELQQESLGGSELQQEFLKLQDVVSEGSDEHESDVASSAKNVGSGV